eukprot:3819598-Amphidinium_carterae.1
MHCPFSPAFVMLALILRLELRPATKTTLHHPNVQQTALATKLVPIFPVPRCYNVIPKPGERPRNTKPRKTGIHDKNG